MTKKGTALYGWVSIYEWKPYTSSGALSGGTVSRKQERTVNKCWSYELMNQGSQSPSFLLSSTQQPRWFHKDTNHIMVLPHSEPFKCFIHLKPNANPSSFYVNWSLPTFLSDIISYPSLLTHWTPLFPIVLKVICTLGLCSCCFLHLDHSTLRAQHDQFLYIMNSKL